LNLRQGVAYYRRTYFKSIVKWLFGKTQQAQQQILLRQKVLNLLVDKSKKTHSRYQKYY
jgi:hypothetical protein